MKTRFALALILAVALVTPCFGAEKSKSAYEQYIEANSMVNDADSVLVKTDMNISMSLVIEDEPMEMDVTASGSVTVVMKSETDMDMQMEMTTSVMGMDIELFGYYTDGMMYMNTMDQKVKMPMPIDEALKQANMVNVDFNEEAIKDQTVTEVEDGIELEFVLDADLLNDDVMSQLGSMSELVGTDMDMSFSDIKVTALIGSDNILKSMFMEFSASIEVQGQEMEMSIEVNAEVVEIGGLEVEFPEDLDEYELTEAQ